MSIRRQQMVRLKFEGKKFRKSYPYLTLSRHAKKSSGAVRECQFEEPTSEQERKATITAYPASRIESVYSTLGYLAQSRTDLERQAEAHKLLGQGQENYPTYQPYNSTFQPGPADQGFTNQQPF
jgi:hypothetical protein